MEAVSAVHAGAEAIRLHVWQPGCETLEATWAGETLRQIRAAVPGVPAGVSTGLWTVGSVPARLQLTEDWGRWPLSMRPGYASVNFSEEGAEELRETFLRLGVGIGAGLESVAEVERLERSSVSLPESFTLPAPLSAALARSFFASPGPESCPASLPDAPFRVPLSAFLATRSPARDARRRVDQQISCDL